MDILETHELTRSFKDLVAVDHLTINIPAGEAFGLLGPNGAGKTTAIKMLTTLLEPSSGTACVDGWDIRKHPAAVRRAIGYVPQILSADGSLTGYENLLISAKLYDVPRADRESKIRSALEFMGLAEAAGRLVREYSGGMIRRLEIAQAVLHRPRVLFLDEPTVGLDPIARKSVWQLVTDLRTEFGITILLTTHFMEEADNLCDRVAIMDQGIIRAMGSPSELKEQIGGGSKTLEEVFIHFTGHTLEERGSYRETARTRRTARRLG